MEFVADPRAWIAAFIADHGYPPIFYVAHPVAPRPGEVVATCTKCLTQRTYMPTDAVDLYKLCDCDAPVRPSERNEEILAFNLRRAIRWWRWFHIGLREAIWLMPWYTNVIANGERDPELIELGLRDDCEAVERCDALMLCSDRVSSGMALEGRRKLERREYDGLEAFSVHEPGPVFQVSGVVGEPHGLSPADVAWKVWRP